ncbi:thiolase family protein [Rhodococcus ruber]|uniref:Thiolase family protein n=1 Tax=Rhodococcus ruber TaxID=1830 RepID=A0ABT4MEU6_9NOCA|nr:thiolase family protein [Rhodococcus ruber]MCZ4519486.1 thiolase family protein [Rhodococcus ruber]
MRDAVVVEAIRTPIGRRGKSLSDVHPSDLSSVVLQGLEQRTGIDPAVVDDVIWGCGAQIGDQSFNIGRNAVLGAGWPESVPATTIDRQCGSSQQAVHFAAACVISGQYEVAVAGGVESMSRVPMGSSMASGSPFGKLGKRRYGAFPDQGSSAQTLVDRWNLSRTQLDEYSAESHIRAAAAQDGGAFDSQIHAVPLGDGTSVAMDGGIRRGSSVQSLAELRPAFREGGDITAGNASQISDGASALLLMTSEKAAKLGLVPLARIHTAVVVADDPVTMLTGPIPATAKVLRKAGLDLSDIGTFEVNEAFASVVLAWLAETGADGTIVNSDGGAIALGHPIGCSGTRLMATLIHRMRRDGIRFGLQTMCEGGGMANATVVELI